MKLVDAVNFSSHPSILLIILFYWVISACVNYFHEFCIVALKLYVSRCERVYVNMFEEFG